MSPADFKRLESLTSEIAAQSALPISITCRVCDDQALDATSFLEGRPVCRECEKPLIAAAEARRAIINRRLSEIGKAS